MSSVSYMVTLISHNYYKRSQLFPTVLIHLLFNGRLHIFMFLHLKCKLKLSFDNPGGQRFSTSSQSTNLNEPFTVVK